MRGLKLGVLLCGVVVACSGRTRSGGALPEPGGEAGAADEAANGGVTSGGGVGLGGPGDPPTSAVRGCPDSTWGTCSVGFDLTLRIDGRSEAENGVWAEPLQVEPPPVPVGAPPADASFGPEAWDRTERPFGACVFRVHGAAPDCFAAHARLTFLACDPSGGPRPVPQSYYELPLCSEGVAPGCPKEPWGNQSYTWYAASEADGAVTVVLCASLCATLLDAKAACLSHPPRITAL